MLRTFIDHLVSYVWRLHVDLHFRWDNLFMCVNSTLRIGIQILKKNWNIRTKVTSRRVRVTIVAVEKQ